MVEQEPNPSPEKHSEITTGEMMLPETEEIKASSSPDIRAMVADAEMIRDNEELGPGKRIKIAGEKLCQTMDELRAWWEANKEYVNDGGREFDHLEAEVFRAMRRIRDFDSANRLIETMTETEHNRKSDSRAGRINVLSREIG